MKLTSNKFEVYNQWKQFKEFGLGFSVDLKNKEAVVVFIILAISFQW